MAARRVPIFLFSFIFFSFSGPVQSQTTTKFTFNGFKGNETQILTQGVGTLKPDGLLRLTDRSQNAIGRAFYRNPIHILAPSSNTTARIISFRTSFVFSIIPSDSDNSGHGFAFTLAPSTDFSGAKAGQYLGLLNESENGNLNSVNNTFVAVEFDTVNGFKDKSDSTGNHIGLNINSLESVAQEPAAYRIENTARNEDFSLDSGEPIQSWIDYDGNSRIINITICPTRLNFRPREPLISASLDLSKIFLENSLFIGFSASTGLKTSSHYIMGWSFSSMDGEEEEESPKLDLPNLPLPKEKQNKNKSDYKPQIVALIAALTIVTIVFIFLLFFFIAYKRRKSQEDVLEDWEIDSPHRFRYGNLYSATKGFKDSEIIGAGGFGTVYKGVLHNSNGSDDLIAVKKITQNSIQGLREFAAEIECLGRLRHKNLVNLQGWCKHKNNLMIIYEYIPNGSLDFLLYRKPRNVLRWDQRFNILKGIASGLMYLHEEWEQVVIHRDVKSSNVLIDSDMNPRLGDFGLARLYDHGTLSHTTNIVGTIGYIAPELARNGKASTASDVFAFGVLVLEVVSGRKPVGSGDFFLADWVSELNAEGRVLDAVDPKLRLGFVADEVRVCLLVGLVCCRQNAAFRPSMRQVLRYLNGDEGMFMVDDGLDGLDSSRGEFVRSSFAMYASSDIINASYKSSSSIGGVSSRSLEACK